MRGHVRKLEHRDEHKESHPGCCHQIHLLGPFYLFSAHFPLFYLILVIPHVNYYVILLKKSFVFFLLDNLTGVFFHVILNVSSQELTNFLYKEPDSQYFRLCRPDGLSGKHATLPFVARKQPQTRHKWTGTAVSQRSLVYRSRQQAEDLDGGADPWCDGQPPCPSTM